MVPLSGYGAYGPYRDLAGHDANYCAYTGLVGLNGKANGEPVIPGFQTADIAEEAW